MGDTGRLEGPDEELDCQRSSCCCLVVPCSFFFRHGYSWLRSLKGRCSLTIVTRRPIFSPPTARNRRRAGVMSPCATPLTLASPVPTPPAAAARSPGSAPAPPPASRCGTRWIIVLGRVRRTRRGATALGPTSRTRSGSRFKRERTRIGALRASGSRRWRKARVIRLALLP